MCRRSGIQRVWRSDAVGAALIGPVSSCNRLILQSLQENLAQRRAARQEGLKPIGQQFKAAIITNPSTPDRAFPQTPAALRERLPGAGWRQPLLALIQFFLISRSIIFTISLANLSLHFVIKNRSSQANHDPHYLCASVSASFSCE